MFEIFHADTVIDLDLNCDGITREMMHTEVFGRIIIVCRLLLWRKINEETIFCSSSVDETFAVPSTVDSVYYFGIV